MTRRVANGDPPSRGSLLRVLGVAFGLAVLVGNTIGMGILRTPGEVAARLPSVPLFMAVWILGAVYAFLGALTVAELAAMRPRSGGLYPLVHDALGEYPGFIVGWTDWLATCGSMAAVAMVFGEYVGSLVPGGVGREAETASAVIVTFGVLQWRGVRIGDVAQQLTSLLKSIALIGLAVVALVTTIDPVLAAPVTPLATPTGLAFAGAIVIALQSAIYTYDGWTGPIYFGEELRDPARDIPRAMIGGVVLVLAIYLSLNAAFLRVVPIREMAGDPFVAATAASRLFGSAGDVVIRVVMLLSLVATINALQLMASRVPFAMSRDRLLPAVFQRVNPGGTPVPALIASTVDRSGVHRDEHVQHAARDAGVSFRRKLRARVLGALRVAAAGPSCLATVSSAGLSVYPRPCAGRVVRLHRRRGDRGSRQQHAGDRTARDLLAGLPRHPTPRDDSVRVT